MWNAEGKMRNVEIKITLPCIKRYFPHLHYAFYHCAGRARRAVNCVKAAVTWSDMCTNYRRSAGSIPHFTFRIPHSAVPHFTHKPQTHTHAYTPTRVAEW